MVLVAGMSWLWRAAAAAVWMAAVVSAAAAPADVAAPAAGRGRHAYAAMMYMGTPRDHEFYVATRVLLRSLAHLSPHTDRVLIASSDLPPRWAQTLKEEDGVKVVTVENLKNPYYLGGSNKRFKLTMNKLYAWSLVDYDRVVMLDADNLFLQNTDELFQCGRFCAVFIHPCYFHTGLFVLEPSKVVFKDMLHDLEIERPNPDGADQGFLINYFPDLLDRPMFHPPSNASKLQGTYRLPLGYQMDASYFYLKLHWNVPCGPNSVITFPGAVWLKPWYWWAWPVLPLGLQWHEQRRRYLGYASELPMMLILAAVYLGIIAVTRLARPSMSKLCHNRRPEKSLTFILVMLKVAMIWSMLAAYTVPFFLIPCTVHPILGWSLYLFGSAALASVVINVFQLQLLPVLTPWLGILGALLVMANPWYSNGVVRALVVSGYAFCAAPFVWGSLVKVMGSSQSLLDRESLSTQMSQISKIF